MCSHLLFPSYKLKLNFLDSEEKEVIENSICISFQKGNLLTGWDLSREKFIDVIKNYEQVIKAEVGIHLNA